MLLMSAGLAATLTEIPPFLRGDISVGYAFDHLQGSLQEQLPYGSCPEGSTEPCYLSVGDRAVSEHRLHYGLLFSVYHGLVIGLDIPHYAYSSISYANTGTMILDPATNTGTFEGVALGTEPVAGYTGSGVGGPWILIGGTPFSEAFAGRNNKATWLVMGGYRFKDGSDHWAFQEGTTRYGAGPGGSALMLSSAFSRHFGVAEPYMSTKIVGEFPYARRVTSGEEGTIYENDTTDGAEPCTVSEDKLSMTEDCVPIYTGNTVDISFGIQVSTRENENSGARFAFDPHLNLHYQSWSSVPSGSYLTGVLSISEGTPVLQSEALEVGAGMRFDVRFFKYLEWRLGIDAYYHMAQKLESQYGVYTGTDTIRIIGGTELVVRVR
jgi:hypothetical protein